MLRELVPYSWQEIFETYQPTEVLQNDYRQVMSIQTSLRSALKSLHRSQASEELLFKFFAYVLYQDRVHGFAEKILAMHSRKELLDKDGWCMGASWMLHAVAIRRLDGFNASWPMISRAMSGYTRDRSSTIPFAKFLWSLGFCFNGKDDQSKTAFHHMFDGSEGWDRESILFAIYMLKRGYNGKVVGHGRRSPYQCIKQLVVSEFIEEKKTILRFMDYPITLLSLMEIEERSLSFRSLPG